MKRERNPELLGAECPWCGKSADAATDPVGDAKPSEGDGIMCAYCFKPGVYYRVFDGLRIRRAADWEAVEIIDAARKALAK